MTTADLKGAWRTFVTCVDLEQALCRLASCRQPLAGRRTAYCSDSHAREFQRNHVWSEARRAARRRARWACQRCGFKPAEIRKNPIARSAFRRYELRLEVNHIQPLAGSYRGVTCLNHQANLEVLCHRCHVEATGGQRRFQRPESQ
jgi:ribosomal protein S14